MAPRSAIDLRAVYAAAFLAVAALLPVGSARGSTIVRFDTVLGDIDVRLFDTATPESVDNFLSYVNSGAFTDSFIHRSVDDFVIQGGGFTFPEGGGVTSVPTDDPVVNEPGLSNLRGTLAYAKLGGDPNSATSGWFFNLSDDNANVIPGPTLDTQNGGFTVFGRVIGGGMSVADAIANQQVINAGGAFTNLPVLDSFEPNTVFREDLVFVNSIQVLSFAAGDYNFDGVVNAADYTVWRSQVGASLHIDDHLNASPSTLLEADGNGDGVVDVADYSIWRDSVLQQGIGALTQVAVPEPSSLLLAVAAAGVLLGVRNHRAG